MVNKNFVKTLLSKKIDIPFSMEEVRNDPIKRMEYHAWLDKERSKDKLEHSREQHRFYCRNFYHKQMGVEKLSQSEVLQFLKKNKLKEFTIVDIVNSVSSSRSSVERCLVQLFRSGWIGRRECKDKRLKYWFSNDFGDKNV